MFNVSCMDGMVVFNESVLIDEMYIASCENLKNPGDDYTLMVASISKDQVNMAEIILTACKQLELKFCLPCA